MIPTPPGEDDSLRSREQAIEEQEVALRQRDAIARSFDHSLQERAALIARREAELTRREESLQRREEDRDAADTGWADAEEHNSQLRQLNEHLVFLTLKAQDLKEAAELGRQRQDEFLAMLAHELRNPLGPIRNAVEILSRLRDKEPVPRPILDIIRRQVQHMVRLLDDLLDVARVTEGKVTLERRPIDIAEPLNQAIEAGRELINERHQQFTLDLPKTALMVNGDGVRLAQVFSNLLHNAAKYTQPGGAISVRVERKDQMVVVRVIDNGMGIATEVRPHVFELFAQDERTVDRSQGGLGIGLTVVRRMVELHGGTVEVRSEGRETGSEFIVSLPLLDQARRDFANSAAINLAPSTGRILLIEDNVEAAEVLAEMLRLSGHDVEVALDGPGGLQIFETFRPQVVLCDIGLPGMDGYEVALRMRERRPTGRPTMIALTGYGSAKDHKRSLAAGFDHHLVKPADPEALTRLIDSAMPAEDWSTTSGGGLSTAPGAFIEPERRDRPG